MARVPFFVACVSVLCLVGNQAAADPVTITSGSIILSQPRISQAGPIAIAGTRGFSIEGVVDSGEGRVDPTRCFPCVPTDNFSVEAILSGAAIGGTATLDGKTYNNINTLTSNNFIFLQLNGTTVLPPVNGFSLVIRAPFTVAPDSFFNYEITPGSSEPFPEMARVALAGRGTATVSLVAHPLEPVWDFNGMRYDFEPVPEPTTLLLVSGGLAATLLRARTHRRKSSPRNPPQGFA